MITPSHNPPMDGGFIQPAERWSGRYRHHEVGSGPRERDPANGLAGVKRVGWEKGRSADTTKNYDFLETYVDDPPNVVNLDAVRDAGIRIGADPLVAQASGRSLSVSTSTSPSSIRNRQFGFRDARLGRQDPDGLLKPELDGVAHREQDAFQISTEMTPTRTATESSLPDAGFDESEPLPVGGIHLYANRPGWPDGCAISRPWSAHP